MMHTRLCLALLVLLSTALGALGCARSNTVVLKYEPVPIQARSCPGKVALVIFEDARKRQAIGQRKDQAYLYPDQEITGWVSRALYEQLERIGCPVQYHEKEYDFDTMYTITGVLEEFWVREESITEFSTDIRMLVTLKKGDKEVFKKNFRGSVEKKAFPTASNNTKVLRDAMQDLLREVVPELIKNMR